MQHVLRTDVVVREGVAVLKLLAPEDQALLVRGGALPVLDLGLDVVDRVRWLDFEGDNLAGECLDKDLHPAVVVVVVVVVVAAAALARRSTWIIEPVCTS